jgi:hypothetical protein
LGKRSVTKGKQFEREVANLFDDYMDGSNSRRGLSQCRGGGAEEADVVNPLFHIECKRQKKPNIAAAFEQSSDDCPQGKIPVAVTKRDRGPTLVTMTAVDFLQIVAAWWADGAPTFRLNPTYEPWVDPDKETTSASSEPTSDTEADSAV